MLARRVSCLEFRAGFWDSSCAETSKGPELLRWTFSGQSLNRMVGGGIGRGRGRLQQVKPEEARAL